MNETVYINGRFLTQRVTGIQRYAREVLAALDVLVLQEMPKVRLVVLAPRGTEAPPLGAIEFQCIGPLQGNFWEQLTLPIAVGRRLLYSFCPTGPLLKRNQVITIHDASVYAVPQAFSWQFRTWYKLVLGVLGRRSRRVMTVSEFSKSEIVRYFGCHPENVYCSVEGWQHLLRVEPDVGILLREGLKPGAFVLAVSSPTPNKNFRLIVQAIGMLSDNGFDVAIAGACDRGVFGVEELPQAPFIKYLGYVSDAELRALYEHAGVFVYPSLYEGFGIPLIEAMASGCPVISSNAASLPEVCGDAAVLVAPDDPAALASAIQRLMSDGKQRSNLISSGSERAKYFSWEAAARVHLDAILHCLDITHEPELDSRPAANVYQPDA